MIKANYEAALRPVHPVGRVWDALEAAGCSPRGQAWKFTARCPAHDDSSPSLSVCEGDDRRALVHCHAGCTIGEITAALGIRVADLFATRRPMTGIAGPPRPFIGIVLDALIEYGIGWRPANDPKMWAADYCPSCPSVGMPLIIYERSDRRVLLACPNGCTQAEIIHALLGGRP